MLPVPAGDPEGVGPEAVARAACLGNWSSLVLSLPSGFVPVSLIPGVSFQSRLEGVDQEVSIFASVARFDCRIRPVFLFLNFFPWISKSSLISPADPKADGLDQEARVAVADRDGPLFLATSFSAPCAVRESFSASEAFGVGQQASAWAVQARLLPLFGRAICFIEYA